MAICVHAYVLANEGEALVILAAALSTAREIAPVVVIHRWKQFVVVVSVLNKYPIAAIDVGYTHSSIVKSPEAAAG